MKEHLIRKILWAVDLDGDTDIQLQTANGLRPFAAATHAAIEPAFVLSPKAHIPPENLPLWEKAFLTLAEKRIAGVASRCELPGIEQPVVLIEPDPSLRAAAKKLRSEAAAKHADLIVVGTRAKVGLSRFLLGSFAETVLLQSRIPVLTINPSAHMPGKIARVLFPTDFGQPSRRGFEAAVGLCKQLGAQLWLYYKMPEPVPAFPEAPVFYQNIEAELKALTERGAAWADWGRRQGLQTHFVLDDKPGDVSQEILDYSKANAIDLIAMVAQSSRFEAIVLGSVVRRIVRHADCPVWIQQTEVTL